MDIPLKRYESPFPKVYIVNAASHEAPGGSYTEYDGTDFARANATYDAIVARGEKAMLLVRCYDIVRGDAPAIGCAYPSCKEAATTPAYNRSHDTILHCCENHAREVAERGTPEYVVQCPNCDCLFGYN